MGPRLPWTVWCHRYHRHTLLHDRLKLAAFTAMHCTREPFFAGGRRVRLFLSVCCRALCLNNSLIMVMALQQKLCKPCFCECTAGLFSSADWHAHVQTHHRGCSTSVCACRQSL